jgi:hypothetical protein
VDRSGARAALILEGKGAHLAVTVAAVQPYGKSAYRELMRRVESDRWVFGSFVDPGGDGRRTIYLRHDVDYSLELAVELAELNNELGVPGTFCVQLCAQFYNPCERVESARLLRLRELGQQVALHYVADPGSAPTPEGVSREFERLRALVPDAAPVFSWHQPTSDLLEAGEFAPPGLVNAYGRRFFREMAYLSDSTHRSSVEELQAEVESVQGSELQLLLHPVNWIAGGSSGAEILIRGWMRVLRDHERTLLANRTYAERFPEGLPTEVLDTLEATLLAGTEPD